MTAFVLARADDWEGLYVGGTLRMEGHSLFLQAVLRQAIEHRITSFEERWVDACWINQEGSLPAKLSECKWGDPQ